MVIAEIAGANMVDIRETGVETLRQKYVSLIAITRAIAVPGKIEDPFLACAASSIILLHPHLRWIHSIDKEDIPKFLNDGHVTITYSQENDGPAIAEIRWVTKRADIEIGEEPFSSSIPIRIILKRESFLKGGVKYLQLSLATFSPHSGEWHKCHGTS